MKTLETERLLLRSFQESDLQAFNDYAKNPNVGPKAGWKPHESLEESKAILDRFIEGDHTYAIVYKENNRLIGSVGIEEDGLRAKIPGCRMLGYVLAEEYWGKGLMPEAASAVIDYVFDEMKIKIFTVNHFTRNKQSRRVIEKCGFQYEGTLRQAYTIYDGTVMDICCYSITRREYLLKKAERCGFSLKLPEELSKEAFEDYHDEWVKSGERMTPFAAGLRDMTYEEWLEDSIRSRTVTPEQFVCATTYFLTDKNDRIVASSNIRHELNESLLKTGGHIGYGVRPSARRNGYAEMTLALSLEKCRDMNIQKALVTCNDDNIGSAKTIEANGGIYENTVEESGKDVRRYWVWVE